jgi:hypothetical protein
MDARDQRAERTIKKRTMGMSNARYTLSQRSRANEEFDEGNAEQIDERELSPGETERKEKYVKSMKKKLKGFKERYGERAKEVMYATATKMAKEEIDQDFETEIDEALKGNQHKLDKNKNKRIDAHDFKLIRSMKKEETEQVDEGPKFFTYKSAMKKKPKDKRNESETSKKKVDGNWWQDPLKYNPPEPAQSRPTQMGAGPSTAAIRESSAYARAMIAVAARGDINEYYSVKDDIALQDKAEECGIDVDILREVYARGVNEWSETETELAAEQYAFNRVNSFISGGLAYRMDSDLAELSIQPRPVRSADRRVQMVRTPDGRVTRKLVRREIKTEAVGADKLMTPTKKPYAAASFSAQIPWDQKESTDCGKSPKDYEKVREALSGKRFVKEDFVSGIFDAPTATDLGMKTQGSFAHHPDVEDHLYEEEHGFTETVFQVTGDEEYEDWGEKLDISEAKYQGKTVSLGKPFLTPGGPKKRAVYVQNDKGNVVKVNFGDPNMTIKKSDPARRRSFRARHQCDTNPGPRHKARYWSCKAW